MSTTVEHEWEVELPAANPEQLLAALAARDRLFGQSISLEPEDDEKSTVEVWIGTVEALEGTTFKLSIYSELTGPKVYMEAAREALEDIVSEQIEAAAVEAGQAKLLGRRPASEVTFRRVDEDEERTELIIPEWLAPEGEEVELPMGFRGFDSKGTPWPGDDLLTKHERVVVLPVKTELLLYSLPPIEEDAE